MMSDKPYDEAKTRWTKITVFAVIFATAYALVKFVLRPHIGL